jgi:GH25 family lysozyme M1 (1,4-beta-N-acetylmuramidase)
MNPLGIDISEGDGNIDWAVVAKHSQFATIRLTYNVAGVDYRGVANMAGAKAAGVARIPYHWYTNRADPVLQAQNFLRHYIAGEKSPLLDLENNGWSYGYLGMWTNVQKWLDLVEAEVDLIPSTYSSPSFIKSYLWNAPQAERYPLIIAHWDKNYPEVPLPWLATRWQAWQFTGKASGPYYGVTQCHDCSLYVMND